MSDRIWCFGYFADGAGSRPFFVTPTGQDTTFHELKNMIRAVISQEMNVANLSLWRVRYFLGYYF